MTDPGYGFWKGWACDDVNLYLVAGEEARRQLTDYGVAPERIRISGMPVHPKFAFADKRAVRRRCAGRWAWIRKSSRCSSTRACRRRQHSQGVSQADSRHVECAGDFSCGEKRGIAGHGRIAGLASPVSDQGRRLYRPHRAIDERGQRHDSKLGGLTTFESLTCRVPIVADAITAPMPQEAGTARLILKHGAGIVLRQTRDIVPVIRRMVEDTVHYSALRSASIGLAIPNATRHIVEEIMAFRSDRLTRIFSETTPPPARRRWVSGRAG